MGNPFVLRPPQVEDPVSQYGRMMQLRLLAQEQQMAPLRMQLAQQQVQAGQQENQMRQMQLEDQQAMRQAYVDAEGDPDKFLANVKSSKYGVSFNGIMSATQGMMQMRKAYMDMSDAQLKHQQEVGDVLQGAHDRVMQAQNKPLAYQQERAKLGPLAADLPEQYPGDEAFGQMGFSLKTASQMADRAMKERSVAAQEQTAGARQLQAETGQKAQAETAAYHGQELGLRKQQIASNLALRSQEMGFRQDMARNQKAQQSYQFSSNQLDKVGQPVEQLVQRMGRLKDTLAQANPQADALVAPELLTVMAGGMGSGLRMNEAEISRIVGGRNAWQSLKSKILRYQTDPSKPFLITPAQRQQIGSLVDEVNRKLLLKQGVLDQAREQLSNSDDPGEHKQIVTKARQQLTKIDEGAGQANQAKFSVPPGAPPATGVPDGHQLKMNGKVIAVARGGQWVAPE